MAMDIKKAIITAAGKGQRTLSLQTLIDKNGEAKTALSIIIEEVIEAGIEEISVIIYPGDADAYREAAGGYATRLKLIEQPAPLGYGHAVYCGREFIGNDPFLLLVGDHLYISNVEKCCAKQLVEVAMTENCSVSAVQATHESKLPYFGAIGGKRVPNKERLYEVTKVIEKPTPTEAEQQLIIPGLRAGHYLCFFGMHVLTPTIMELLEDEVKRFGDKGGVQLSSALSKLSQKERHLAYEVRGRRYDIGVKYGLLTAQIAIALSGKDRDEILCNIIELLSTRIS